MSEAATPDPGPLSVDQAVAALTPEPVDAAPEAPVEAAAEPDEIEGETSSPDDADAELEELAQAEDAEAEPVEAAEPPKYWSKDAKEAFAALPPDLQAVVLAQEGPREEAAAKAKAEAAAKIAEAEAETGKVTQLAGHLAEFLPQALETFRSRWGDEPDWVAVAQEHGPEAMTLAKVQYDAEKSQLQKLVAAKQDADTLAHQAYVKGEFTKLSVIAPDLAPDPADPRQGHELRQSVVKYAIENGVDESGIPHISAAEMLIAHKAQLWDQAQAKLATRPGPKPAATAPRPAPVRPSAAQAQSPTQRTATSVQNRFNAKPDVDNAVALLLARKA